MNRLILGALALVLLAACSATDTPSAQDPTPPPVTLDGTWHLQKLEIDGAEVGLDDVSVTLVVDGRKISGNGGCNRYFTTLRDGIDTVTVKPIASTKMACDGPRGTVETAYFDALAKASLPFIVDDVLTWTGGGASLKFERS